MYDELPQRLKVGVVKSIGDDRRGELNIGWENISNQFNRPIRGASTIRHACGGFQSAQYVHRHAQKREPDKIQKMFKVKVCRSLEAAIVSREGSPEGLEGEEASVKFDLELFGVRFNEGLGATGNLARGDAVVLTAHSQGFNAQLHVAR